MSRQARLVVAVLAGAIALAVLMVALRPAPEERPRETGAPLVRTLPLTPASGPIAVLGSGTVEPREEVTVSSEIAGRIVYVNPAFRQGGLVQRGAVLFRIDASDYENRVRSASADVAAQDVAILEAREEARIARDELQRFSALPAGSAAGGGAIGQTGTGDQHARILPPRALANGGRPVVQGAPGQLATREPQLRSARAARDRAAAQLADARLALGRTVVRAPFSGLVRNEEAAIGRLVQPGQELGSIVASDGFDVRISLTEAEAALIPDLLNRAGSRIPASVLFDFGGQSWQWAAFVDRINPILDPATRTIDVILRVPDPFGGAVPVAAPDGAPAAAMRPPPLLVGSFVSARITGSSATPYAEIPAQHLRPGNEIWVVRGGKLRILPVRVIQRTDTVAYITLPSLGEGGQLVTSALRAPVDGMAVRVEGAARGSSTPAARAKTDG